MARFSPTVRPRTGREGEPRAADRIIQALDMLRRDKLQQEDRERQEEFDEMRKQRHQADMHRRGFREEAPTEDVRLPASDEDVLTRDIDLGGAPGGARTRRARELESVLFPGAGPAPRMETDRGPGGMAGAPTPSPGAGGPLVDELEGLKRRGPTLPPDAETGPRESRGRGDTGALGADEFMIRALDQVRQQGPAPRGQGGDPGEGQDPDVRHPPGAFVPEAMDFTTEAIFEGPQVDTRIGLQRPAPERTVERVPDRVEQVGDDLFFDPEATPEARERAQQARTVEALGRLRNATPEQMEALRAGVDPRQVFTEEETREGFTEDELRRADVPEDLIPAALRDPVLARQAIRDAQEGEEGAEGADPAFQDRLEAVLDVEPDMPRQRAEGIARDATTFRQFLDSRRGPSARDDFVGRRQRAFDAAKRILDLREQTFEGGFEPSGEELRSMNQEIQQTLALFGYNDMSELQQDMRRFGLDQGAVAGGRGQGGAEAGSEPGTEAEADLPPIEQRIDELIAEGLSDEEIAETLREEGYR